MKSKVRIMLIGLLAGFLLLSACGEQERQLGVEGYVYVQREIEDNDELKGMHRGNLMAAGGYLYYMKDKEIFRIPAKEELNFEDREEVLSEDSLAGMGADVVLAYTVDEERNVYYYVIAYNEPGFSVYKYSEDGKKIYHAPVYEGADNSMTRMHMAVDAKGNVYVLSENYLIRIDAKGNFTGKLSLRDYCTGGASASNYLLKTPEGRVFFFSEYNLSRRAYEILGEDTPQLVRKENLEEDISFSSLYEGYDGLLMEDEGYLYKVDADTGSVKEVLRWEDSDMYYNNIQDIAPVAKDRFLVLTQTGGEYDFREIEGVEIVKTKVSDLPQKELIVLASIAPSYDLQAAVIDFNKSSEKYHVTIETYGAKTMENIVDAAITRLDSSLTTKDAPDLLDLSYLDFYSKYSEIGALEDLNGYIGDEGGIRGEDYLANVLEGYTTDGKLLCIPQSFQVFLMYGNDPALEESKDWTMESLMELAEKYPDKNIFFTKGAYNKAWMILDRVYGDYYLEKYIDWEKGECYFDSEGFCSLLQWINGQISDSEKESLLQVSYLYGFGSWRDVLMDSGDDIKLYGSPSADGRPNYYVMADNMVSITVNSGHKEGAWEFLQYYLQNGKQVGMGFPTRMDRLTEMAWDVTEKENPDENTSVSYIIKDGVWIPEPDLTPGQAEALWDVLNALDFTPRSVSENKIVSIVTEEAESYFSGSKPLEEVTKIIQSRAQILIQESQ